MSSEFPKYYTHKDGFVKGELYVVRVSNHYAKLIMVDGTKKQYQWGPNEDRFVEHGAWVLIPREVIESGNVYAFDPASGPDQSGTALWSGTKMIASIDGKGVLRFKVDATEANAAEFITMIEEFLQRRVTAIDVTKSEPATLPV